MIGKSKPITGLAVSPSGTWLVGTGGQKAYVANTSSLKDGFTKFVSSDALTCLAFHPTDELFATGDEKGHVRLWYCLNEGQISFDKLYAEKKATTTVFHWHAHPVQSIAFTTNGAYMLSGGEEAVLVIWQLETGHKEFVPRVGSPIRTISVAQLEGSPQEYLLGLSDGTLAFVSSATLKISRSTTRMKLSTSLCLNSLLCVHPLLFRSRAAERNAGTCFSKLKTANSGPSKQSLSHPSVLSPFIPSNILALYIQPHCRA
jgi:NET1-associated nuclear protein 1 (U3 small nucleolar RNA-associated protein 17)